ncbi:diguanylate cyclase [Terasakiella sp. A23]|uniref:diguanylate cyclase n=1 Tax=Terasakiella sp. FCG-A23 TaxID=3080561 RepID=UPI0029558C3D|nr:diguanylate cyclase [Terasakiella sp. A23]MDV7338458.1 diguanylate cyclase [Terasakiella sp. A23]
MRIQHQIFLAILLVFTCVFGLATWFYYYHFSQELHRSETQQVNQINRYVEREINDTLKRHHGLMQTLNKDGDVASAYDDVNWLAFMGRKFITKSVADLFERYPYFQSATFYKEGARFINVAAPATSAPPNALIEQSILLDVPDGKLVLRSNILKLLQAHLKDNKINRSTRLYFETDRGAWLVSSQSIEKVNIQLNINQSEQIKLPAGIYLSSPRLSGENWSLHSLLSQTATTNALNELLFKAVMAYLASALLFFVIARYLSHLMIRPLRNLEKAAVAIMSGDYSPIKTDQADETKPAIEAFNLMSKRIQGFTQELQDQVAARTKELEIANAELALMNETDILTGARSRQFLTHHAPNLIKLANRSGLSVGVAMLDIDYFKKINDTYGHVKGDECLIAFVDEMHRIFRRDNDWVIRYGGEEFCLICFGQDHDSFKEQLAIFRLAVEQIKIADEENGEITFTVSIGYNHYDEAPEQWSDPMIGRADELLYKAKRSGRNRIEGEQINH